MRRPTVQLLLLFLGVLAMLQLAACPVPKQQGTTPPTGTSATAVAPLKVVLVLTELGIGDGSYAREADDMLSSLEQEGLIAYTPVGQVPLELTVESVSGDVGLPAAGPALPGSMELAQAELLLTGAPESDLLVLTTPLLLDAALAGVDSGGIKTGAILVLDNEGYAPGADAPPVPVYVVEYNVKDIAFLSGVAVAQSSSTSMFIAMAVATDPQADDFLAAAKAGARFQSSGAQMATIKVPVDPAEGYVTPELFLDALNQVREEAGPYFQCNHYILSLGRATPSVMLALTGEPENAYTIGAYADYRRVRPSRVVGCAVKRPGQALEYILRNITDPQGLDGLGEGGMIRLGLTEDAVGFTDFEYYGRYNRDSADIEQAVERIEALIRADELDYDY